jgi:hypothetical protein
MRAPRAQVILSAPGAGLGHLVRAAALWTRLEALGVTAEVLTSSPFAPGVARLTRARVTRLPDRGWAQAARTRAQEAAPRLLLIDSFPFGLRGEWRTPPPARIRCVYLARRLALHAYLDHLQIQRDPQVSRPAEDVIRLEPLTQGHEGWLARSRARTRSLPGRVRYPAAGARPPALPDQVAEMIAQDRLDLVVHSGPAREVQALIAAARARRGGDDDAPLFVIAPRPAQGPARAPGDVGAVIWLERFPASPLFGRARLVVTGAGYNLMAEMAPHRARHLAVPFERRYDDQAGRLADAWESTEDGGPEAARIIAEMVRG